MSVDIQLLLEQGESETVEFKEIVKHPAILARYLSAFSNTDGGLIVVGVREPNHITGISQEKLRSLFNAAIKKVTGPIKAEIEFKEFEGKNVGIIHVQKSAELVGSSDGIFKRDGERTIALSAENITRMVHKSPDIESSLSTLCETISRQSQEISRMSDEVQKLNSWKRKIFWIVLGAIVGAFARAGVPYIEPLLSKVVG
ncbi:AlbA family DNA-binding domain-containing protein [Pseudomonas sp. MBLB4123]|uniref:AlbA family DNA-binding domain-containing protein n=1 Tax=Pseudomonas sp. MBLB4123 TaxID=3451557 RepID=UPI003F750B7E